MKKTNAKRNQSVGVLRDVEDSMNVVIFPNTLSSDLYIDSDDRLDGTVSKSNFKNKSVLIPAQVSRIGLKFIDMTYKIPNSNVNNNVYSFELFGDSTKTFTLPIKNYETVSELHQDIKNSMETAAIPSILVIDFVQNVDNPVEYTMTSSIGIKFNQCLGISFGQNLHNIPYTKGFITSIKTLPSLYYSRYIDILISEIKDAQVISHRFGEPKSFNTNNHLTRLFIPFENNVQLTNFSKENININHYSYRHKDTIELEIILLDEFGNTFPTITQSVVTEDPNTTSIVELNYIKYNLVLNIIG